MSRERGILIDGDSLTLDGLRRICFDREKVFIDENVRAKIAKARAVVEQAAHSNELVYSINTGFGILSKVRIAPHQLDELQLNIIRSHCCNVGEAHSEVESRALLCLRANVLAKGHSGVRVELVDLLLEMLNRGVHPVVPVKGSVGSSGDLSPLAHLASVLIGEGEAFYEGKRMAGKSALASAGLQPIRLAAKEGLSLINGTQQMTTMAALQLLRAEALVDLADLTCSATLEGILGSPRAFAGWIQEARPYEGQKRTAANLRRFMESSEIYQSHLKCDRVQDPYSVRCAPQVHGAARDLIDFARRTVQVELNAATDNPLVNAESNEIVSGGNFHGQPIAFALDIMGMAVAELGSISERRIVKLLNPVFSELPTFLIENEGLNSGLMIPQYTAAHLVVENRVLSHPASTDSIPTNNDKEDHNSMGPIAAHKLKTILTNAEYILAIEALTACQALEFRRPLQPGIGPRFLHRMVRAKVAPLVRDRYLAPDIEAVAELFRSGEIHRLAQKEGLL